MAASQSTDDSRRHDPVNEDVRSQGSLDSAPTTDDAPAQALARVRRMAQEAGARRTIVPLPEHLRPRSVQGNRADMILMDETSGWDDEPRDERWRSEVEGNWTPEEPPAEIEPKRHGRAYHGDGRRDDGT